MKYCRKHDLAFCEKHLDQCGERCTLADDPRAVFCAVCSGLLKPIAKPVQYDADYFLRGKQNGISLYEDYRWMPDLTIPMVKSIIQHLGIKSGVEGNNVLDFGCARGYIVKAFREAFKVEAQGWDVSEWAIRNADEATRPYLHLAADSPPLLANEFDFVIAKDVLEHIPQVADTITDLMRVASVAVFAVVPLSAVDNQPYVVADYEKDVTHVHRLTLASWARMFMRPGWRVEAAYRLKGVKDNYATWENGNGFITARRCEK